MTNVNNETVDLIFFSWTPGRFEALHRDERMTSLYGAPVYAWGRVSNSSIATQDDHFDQLANFSYVFGGRRPGDWKPHPGDPDRTQRESFSGLTDRLQRWRHRRCHEVVGPHG